MKNSYILGAELEFYISTQDGNFIADLSTGKYPQKRYQILPEYSAALEDFVADLKDYSIVAEDGPGQFEVNFQPEQDAKKLAKAIEDFKSLAREKAESRGLLLHFTAKPFAEFPGNGLHIHYSSNLFDPYGLELNGGVMTPKVDPENDYILWAIGGCLEKMANDIGVFLPTEESKKRILPWLNAPTKICWGKNNRSVAIRIPDKKPKRLEHRVAGADADAGSVIAAVVAACEYGIENMIEPPEAIFGNAWDEKYEIISLL